MRSRNKKILDKLLRIYHIVFMQAKGTIKVKPTLTKPGTLCGEISSFAGQVLTVMDIADDGYLVMNKDQSGLGDIHKDDVEWFRKATPSPMELVSRIASGKATIHDIISEMARSHV